MSLKEIRIAGFKSFPDPTRVPLPSNLVGVVGPNGCGKSNIIDAVRWVMGENSAKNLRGESAQDVIFNGSSTRKPLGQASIELHFDNQNGKFGGPYAEYSEIVIRRELARDGQSRYFLNGQHCRRKDVIGLFQGTGLAASRHYNYAIIQQNRISTFIDAKPADMLQFVQEAAGISNYLEKKHETELRLEHTQTNLARLNDLREEVVRQLGHLEHQAKSAERYQLLKQEEQQLKLQFLAGRLQRLQAESGEWDEQIKILEVQQQQRIDQKDEITSELSQYKQILEELMQNQQVQDQEYFDLTEQIATLEKSIAFSEQQKQHLLRELTDIVAEQSHAEGECVHLEQQIKEQQQKIAEIEPQWQQKQAAYQQAEQQLTEIKSQYQICLRSWQQSQTAWMEQKNQVSLQTQRQEHLQQKITQINHDLQEQVHGYSEQQQSCQQLTTQLSEIEQQITLQAQHLETEKQQLQELQAALENQQRIAAQVRKYLDETQSRLQEHRGEHASLLTLQQQAMKDPAASVREWLDAHQMMHYERLMQQLRVKKGWERAVETVLADKLRAVVVSKNQLTDTDLQELLKLQDGDLIFALRDTHVTHAVSSFRGLPRLSDQIESAPLLHSVLEQVFCVDDLQSAIHLRDHLALGQSLITPDGIWFGVDWVRYHPGDVLQTGLIDRNQQIQTLAQSMTELNTQVLNLEQQLGDAHQQMIAVEKNKNQQHAEVTRLERAAMELQLQHKLFSERKDKALQQLQRHEQTTLQLRNQQDQISAEQSQLEQTIEQAMTAAVDHLQTTQELEQQKLQLDEQQKKAEVVLDQLRQEEQSELLQQQRLQQSLQHLQSQKQSFLGSLQTMQDKRDRIDAELLQLGEPLPQLEQDHLVLSERRQELAALRSQQQHRREELQQQLNDLERRRDHTGSEQVELQQKLQTLRINRQTTCVRLQTLQEDVALFAQHHPDIEDIDLALQQASLLPNRLSELEAEEQLSKLHHKINRLGPINLAAMEEFAQTAERKGYLDQQLADLNSAVETLQQAIQRIDRESSDRFRETFDQINQAFQNYFPRLFGGGQSYLEMVSDAENGSPTGVAVMARPPGKRNSTIHLLSGGEKALTAIALVFAFFQLNPAPFCMLDEVDAPLDEANVVRYSQLIKEMSKQLQFIFISHNKVTMEIAEQLLGVTMNEPGVSRLVAVDIASAVKMAEAG